MSCNPGTGDLFLAVGKDASAASDDSDDGDAGGGAAGSEGEVLRIPGADLNLLAERATAAADELPVNQTRIYSPRMGASVSVSADEQNLLIADVGTSSSEEDNRGGAGVRFATQAEMVPGAQSSTKMFAQKNDIVQVCGVGVEAYFATKDGKLFQAPVLRPEDGAEEEGGAAAGGGGRASAAPATRAPSSTTTPSEKNQPLLVKSGLRNPRGCTSDGANTLWLVEGGGDAIVEVAVSGDWPSAKIAANAVTDEGTSANAVTEETTDGGSTSSSGLHF